ncbi:substrate-binding domain-containing protein, partial [Vibrio vulnificus]
DELQISVPDQVAVVGFDGITDSAYFTPPLTTVKQDFTAIGRQAVIEAINLKDNNSPNSQRLRQINIPVELVVRRSSENKSMNQNNKRKI